MPAWTTLFMPFISAAADEMIEKGALPIEIAEAFDDFGHFLQRVGADMMQERLRRGMSMPSGPED